MSEVKLPENISTEVPPVPTVLTAPTPVPTASLSAKEGISREEFDAQMREMSVLAKKNKELQLELESVKSKELAEQGKFKELYEQEKASRERDVKEMRKKAARAELRTYALGSGAVDPDVADLISMRDLKVDEETGEYTNIRDLVDAHKNAKPHLYSAGKSQGESAPERQPVNTGTGGNPPKVIEPKAKDVSAMSPEEYRRAKQSMLSDLRRSAER